MTKIIVNGVWKKFSIGAPKKQRSIEKAVYSMSGRETKENFWVLKNISFMANEGDIVGIIGKNGSGKSTLCRIIGGIYTRDKGNIKVEGKLISLINLNEGLKLRLTMKENIFLCCSILGLTNKEIKKRFNEIVTFSELEKYVDTKLYQFSNGMLSRLAISIGFYSLTKGNSIILIDEETNMTDKQFKLKCEIMLKKVVSRGSIVLFASHDLETIKKLCDKIIWIDQGRVIKEGGKEVIEKYILNSLHKNTR